MVERVDRTSSPVHTGNLRNAIDFIVPEYTPVLAAANGIVAYVKDDSTIGGPNPIYQKYTNFITIMHANEEYSRYDHLAPRSSKVEVGQTVKEGQEIAQVALLPPLHFHVFIFIGTNVWVDFDTLKVEDFIS
ncbi:MAG: M23 family metallopeptidase [Candidatus Nitrosopolaris sp.]